MNLDDVGRNAAQDVSAQADSVTPPEFATVQRNRQVRTRWAVATSLAAAAVLFVGVTVLVRSPEGTSPFVSDPVPAPTTITLAPDGQDQTPPKLEEEDTGVEGDIGEVTTSVTLATGPASSDPSGRDVLEVPYVFDLPQQRGVWARIDDPDGAFAVESFSESRQTEDGGTFSSSSGVRVAGIADGPGGLIAAGSVTRGLSSIGAMWRSTDGTTWERVAHVPAVFGSLGEGTDVAVRALASDASSYVAVGTSGDSAIAWTSSDGVTWDVHVLQTSGGNLMSPLGVERVEFGWVATGAESDPTRPPDDNQTVSTVVHSQGAIWWSPDGQDWQRVESESLVSSTSNLHVLDVVETQTGRLYAVGVESWDPVSRSDGVVWFSDDGFTWNRVETSDTFGPGETGIESIANRDGLLVAVGSSGGTARIWSSTDGISWNVAHQEDPNSGDTWIRAQDLVVTDTGLVAVGLSITTQEGELRPIYRIVSWSSNDGVSWSPTEPPQDRADGFVWDAIDFNGNLIAVGELNAIPSKFDNDRIVSLGTDVGAVWMTPTPESQP